MTGRGYNDGIAYGQGEEYTPASDTEISPRPIGILLDATGSVTVRYESSGAAHAIPLAGGVIHPIEAYSIDSIATATEVHIFR